MLRCLLLLAAAASAEATTLRFLFTGVRNDNNNVGQSIDISLSEIVVYDAGSNALAVASAEGAQWSTSVSRSCVRNAWLAGVTRLTPHATEPPAWFCTK